MTPGERLARALLVVGMIVAFALLIAVLAASPAHAATPPVPPSVVATRDDPDQTGVRASAYTGWYYRPADEGYRRCVAFREGRGFYGGTGRNGFYQSTYQMTNALVRGAAWMMTDELKSMWPDRWRLIRNTLLDTPGHLWHRFWMDMAWWTVVNWDGPRSGVRHWHLAGSRCVPGMAIR